MPTDLTAKILGMIYAGWWLLAFLAGFFVLRHRLRTIRNYERMRNGQCRKCGYLLRGNVSGVCPECGTGLK